MPTQTTTTHLVRRTEHAVVEVPIAGRHGEALPLLMLGEGELSLYAASYIRDLHLKGSKPASLQKTAKAIGLLYDYYTIEKNSPALDDYGFKQLFKQFYEARRYGCSNLGWTPVRLGTAKNDLRFVSEFSSFCAENFGHAQANPKERRLIDQQTGAEFQAWLLKAKARKKHDMLLHLYGTTQEAAGVLNERGFNPEAGKTERSKTAKYFPPGHVLDFIAAAPSLRDRLCWMLLFFGGLRISELAHLYVRDVSYDKATGMAKITLADPVDATIDWEDEAGRKQRTTRAEFLLRRYGRIPRNRLASKHPEHAGWKSMLYEDTRRKESEIYWIDNRVGEMFWHTHQQYMRQERLAVGDINPYYFVSLRSDDSYGSPIKLSNLHKLFDSNSERIGLSPSSDGVNPHGARHFYGYFSASWLKLSIERVTKMMHHKRMSSTEVYYALDKAVVRDELFKAQEKMAKQLPAFVQDIGKLENKGAKHD